MILAAGLLLLSYLSAVIDPARFWFMSLFGLLFVPLTLLNLFLLVWAVKRRSRTVFIPLVILLPAIFCIGRYVQMSSKDIVPEGGRELSVISYNVGRFALSSKDSGISGINQCTDSVLAFLKKKDADIICLQEFYVRNTSEIRSYLTKKFKGYYAEYYMFTSPSGSYGNVTLSRFPATGKGRIEFERSSNLAFYTDFKVGEERFRVYNCHFESYNISLSGIVKALGAESSTIFKETGAKMRSSIIRRPRQVDKVIKNIENCSLQSVVCGDFNDNPMSYTYHRLSRGKADSFMEAGHGFGATYSYLWPMLRIDYILYPESFRVLAHETLKVGYSDHYPVITKVEI